MIEIKTDYSNIIRQNVTDIGVTLTQVTPAETKFGTIESRTLANTHIDQMPDAVYNVHAFGFGTINNVVDINGNYNWDDLDRRMQWLKDRKATHVCITFWSAPDWMTELGMQTTQYILKVDCEQAFADLCCAVLQRYTSEGWNMPIKKAQFWNEMKGYGNITSGWNIQRFTHAYNLWYTTIRLHSEFSSIALAGPYFSIDQIQAGTVLVMSKNLNVLDYWYTNKAGADAISIDRTMSYNAADVKPLNEYMRRTFEFAQIAYQMHARYIDLPIWFSEFYWYSYLSSFGPFPIPFQAACTASILLHSMFAGAELVLGWQMQNDGRFKYNGVQMGWLNDTRPITYSTTAKDIRGDKTLIYDVYKLFYDHFIKKPCYNFVNTRSDLVECMVTDGNILLINKTNQPLDLTVDNQDQKLSAYEVKLAS